jgi:branched-chain amino acid transport system permease protein
MNFLLSYIILAQIYAILAISTNLMVGIIGIFSVAQAAIMGIGAYIYAICAMNGLDFVTSALIAISVCALFNIITSLPALRLAGDYFVVTSFGIQIIASAIFINWAAATGGASGIPGIPAPTLFGRMADTNGEFVVISTLALVLAATIFWLMMRSVYGRMLNAIRLDEIAAAAAGRDVLRAKLGVSAVSGGLAAMGGVLFASYFSYIDPSSFEIHVSVLFLTMLVVGGARTLTGSILGPLVILAIPQLLALIELPSTIVGPMRQLAYGVILVAFMLLRPQGIAGQKL